MKLHMVKSDYRHVVFLVVGQYVQYCWSYRKAIIVIIVVGDIVLEFCVCV